jgi:hypothetical protein
MAAEVTQDNSYVVSVEREVGTACKVAVDRFHRNANTLQVQRQYINITGCESSCIWRLKSSFD